MNKWILILSLDERTKTLFITLLIGIIFSLALSMIDLIRPLYVNSLGGTIIEIGLITSTISFIGVIFMLPSGILADSFNRKKIIIISLLLCSISISVYSICNSWEQLFIPVILLAL